MRISRNTLIGFAAGLIVFVPVLMLGFACPSGRPILLACWLALGALAVTYVYCVNPVVKQIEQVLTIAPMKVLGSIEAFPTNSRSDEVLPGLDQIQRGLDSWVNVPGRQIFVTSGDRQDGKTLIASSLAVGLARKGLCVTLVDVNSQNASIHKIFNTPESPGLSEFLHASGNMDWQSIMHQVKDNLRIVCLGRENVSLCSETFMNLSQSLRDASDVIIFDCGSVNSKSNWLESVGCGDYVLATVRLGHTCTQSLKQLFRQISQRKIADAGLILIPA